MSKFIRISTISILMSIASCFAATSTDPNIPQIKKNLNSSLPDLVIDQILPTTVAGVYEIDSGRKVFYVDSTGKYAFVGNMLDLTTKSNLTQERTTELNRIDWNKLPTDVAIRRVIGNGQNKIAIFTDPDCPFCKRLENETVPNLENVTIYYYFFPLSIHPTALSDSKRILCAENPEDTLVNYMAKGKALPKNDKCNNAKKITVMQDLGNNLVQVTGTPTIILPNGRILSGLVPADYLSRMIDQNKAESNLVAK